MQSLSRRLAWLATISLGSTLFVASTAAAAPLVPVSGATFTSLQTPFSEETYGTTSAFLGGVAFAPNGDVWADECEFGNSELHRFSSSETTTVHGSTIHGETVVPSNAGCGLTNAPDGKIYSNTSAGVVTIDSSTGAALATGGLGGNALGIAYDPRTGGLAYPDQACRFSSS